MPEFASGLFQIYKLGGPVDSESLGECRNFREICDMAWVEIEMLDQNRFDNLFSFLDLKQKFGVTVDVVENLAAQILRKVVK